jgi:hypothetical protein
MPRVITQLAARISLSSPIHPLRAHVTLLPFFTVFSLSPTRDLSFPPNHRIFFFFFFLFFLLPLLAEPSLPLFFFLRSRPNLQHPNPLHLSLFFYSTLTNTYSSPHTPVAEKVESVEQSETQRARESEPVCGRWVSPRVVR